MKITQVLALKTMTEIKNVRLARRAFGLIKRLPTKRLTRP